jgi:hypothetical protein
MGTRIALTSSTARRILPLALAAAFIAALCLGRGATPVHAAGVTMTVNTTADTNSADGVLSLREGILPYRRSLDWLAGCR